MFGSNKLKICTSKNYKLIQGIFDGFLVVSREFSQVGSVHESRRAFGKPFENRALHLLMLNMRDLIRRGKTTKKFNIYLFPL